MPAGFLENGETIEQGAIRETLEEAELKVKDLKLFTVISVPHIDQVYTFFTAKIINHDFGPTAESSEVKLFNYEDIPWKELAFPTVIRTIKLFLKHGDKEVFNEVIEYGP